MATITANATVSLNANGNTQTTGSITWTRPNIPSNAQIDSITISGSFTWKGKGSVIVTINDTTCNNNTPFNINLPTNTTSPYTNITCRGNNKNSAGNVPFSNVVIMYNYTLYYNVEVGTIVDGSISVNPSGRVAEGTVINITATPNPGYEIVDYFVNGSVIGGTSFTATQDSVVTATFQEILEKFFFKENGSWVAALETYKKIGGQWVLQTDLGSLFAADTKFVKKDFIGGEKVSVQTETDVINNDILNQLVSIMIGGQNIAIPSTKSVNFGQRMVMTFDQITEPHVDIDGVSYDDSILFAPDRDVTFDLDVNTDLHIYISVIEYIVYVTITTS